MAKNWQYGRLRTVALQVVMWLTFGASLGLAAYIDHRRSGALDVRLGEAIIDGRLAIRIPIDWEIDLRETIAGPPRTLVLKDFDGQGLRRTVRITQEQQVGRARSAEYYLAEMMNARRLRGLEPQPFSMLGQNDGVLVPFKVDYSRLPDSIPETAKFGLPEPGLYACVVLPDNFTVTLQVVGDGAYGPSSWKLLRTLADSIRLADATADGVSATRSRTTRAIPIEEP